MNLFPKPYADFVARLRVFTGFVLVAVFAWLARPTRDSLAVGLPVALLGLALRAWAAGCLYKNQQLTTGGPYAYIRNPLYVGTSLAAAGFVIAAARWELAILSGAVFFFIYLPVIGLEEQHLRDLFPEFDDYTRRVGMLIPRSRITGGLPFTFAQYLHNREYEALAGFLAGAAFLVWKAASGSR
jgi:protein-S-isoprenylcysteine O-methyltransferase Ste14